ncbi:MAG: M56 family metallopeptidase, partial [Myxococcota bacterium]
MQLFWTLQVAIASLGLTAMALDRAKLPFRTQQRTIRVLVLLCPLVFLVAAAIPRGQWEPAERWMPETVARDVASPASPAEKSDGSRTIPTIPWFPWWWLPSGLLLIKFSRDAWLLHRRVGSARAVEPFGGVSVRLASDGSTYAAFTATGPVIVLDPQTWDSDHDRPIALAHEAQHHAHGDPVWAWVFGLVPVLGALNPFAYALVRRVRLLDELAVDAVLAPADPPAYAASILRGARRQVAPRLALAASSAPLDTRIRTML